MKLNIEFLADSDAFDYSNGISEYRAACRGKKRTSSEENHKLLFLVLYDLLTHLYGTETADQAVATDKTYGAQYVNAWEWALSISKDERRKRFDEILAN